LFRGKNVTALVIATPIENVEEGERVERETGGSERAGSTLQAGDTIRKTMAGSTQNQPRIIARGCCFGRVGRVRLQ
jgi:hypothetical protein